MTDNKYVHICNSEFEWHLFRRWAVYLIMKNRHIEIIDSNSEFTLNLKGFSLIFKRTPLEGKA